MGHLRTQHQHNVRRCCGRDRLARRLLHSRLALQRTVRLRVAIGRQHPWPSPLATTSPLVEELALLRKRTGRDRASSRQYLPATSTRQMLEGKPQDPAKDLPKRLLRVLQARHAHPWSSAAPYDGAVRSNGRCYHNGSNAWATWGWKCGRASPRAQLLPPKYDVHVALGGVGCSSRGSAVLSSPKAWAFMPQGCARDEVAMTLGYTMSRPTGSELADTTSAKLARRRPASSLKQPHRGALEARRATSC